jgi:hypothetical protein
MKNLLIFASVLLVSAAIVVSCSKDEQKVQTPISVVDGRLVFESQEVFENQMKYLFENQDNLEGFENQFVGFTSSRQAFDNFTEEKYLAANSDMSSFKDYAILLEKDGEKYMEAVVDAELLSYVVNDKGLIQIGDKIHKYTYEKVYIFDVNQLAKFQANGINGLSDVKGYPIGRDIQLLAKQDILECFNYYNDDKRRLVGEVSRINGPAYAEVKVTTKNHKKSLGTWIRSSCTSLTQDGDVSFDKTVTNVTISHTVSSYKHKTQESHMSKVLDWTALTGTTFVLTASDVHHSGSCSQGVECDNDL